MPQAIGRPTPGQQPMREPPEERPGGGSRHVRPARAADRPRERRLAVLDLGSNSFRLVVFSWIPELWFKRTDEILESVRIGEGLETTGALGAAPMERGLATLELFADFCRAMGIAHVRALATSAIRDASNQAEFLRGARERAQLEVQVLSGQEEARFGYLAAINSTTLHDGITLDLGGGSMQLVRVARRRPHASASWPLGAVRMTERFLPAEKAKTKQIMALRAHVRSSLADAPWLVRAADGGGRMVGIGGTLRTLAAAVQRRQGLPTFTVQGFVIAREALGELIAELADLPASKRGGLPGIKPERGELVLAGAVVIETAMELGGFDAIEVCEAGLREGVLFATLLPDGDGNRLRDVRSSAVVNLAAQYHADFTHTNHMVTLTLEMWEALADAGLHGADPLERELLWAAGMLHDIGMAVDYDEHHKHSRYLILNGGLPGYSPRETALIAQMARYHRKGAPRLRALKALAQPGDKALLRRCVAVLRLAEQLERSRDQSVAHAHVTARENDVALLLDATREATVARWAAQKQADMFARAFGRELRVEDAAPGSHDD